MSGPEVAIAGAAVFRIGFYPVAVITLQAVGVPILAWRGVVQGRKLNREIALFGLERQTAVEHAERRTRAIDFQFGDDHRRLKVPWVELLRIDHGQAQRAAVKEKIVVRAAVRGIPVGADFQPVGFRQAVEFQFLRIDHEAVGPDPAPAIFQRTVAERQAGKAERGAQMGKARALAVPAQQPVKSLRSADPQLPLAIDQQARNVVRA